jgi:hypothetical protein
MQIYLTSFYFIVTTITTVGYGDILAASTFEKLISIFLMLCGTFFFAYASSLFTTLLTSLDQEGQEFLQKKRLLQRLHIKFNFQPDLYYEVLKQLTFNYKPGFEQVTELTD